MKILKWLPWTLATVAAIGFAVASFWIPVLLVTLPVWWTIQMLTSPEAE